MKAASLSVLDPEGEQWTVELSEAETLIGRSPSADLRINDKAISRDHACISFEDGQYLIEDLQTTNGTKVNGKRVRSGELQDGDTIQLGQTTIKFQFA